MSGPKIVRIVTREEVEAICRGHLEAVDSAIDEVERCAKRHEVLTDPLVDGLELRRETLHLMFEQDRWAELQKQAPLDVSFLRSEVDRIRAQAVAAAEARRSRRRRTADAARTLISAFEAAGVKPPQGVVDVAARAMTAEESALGAMQSALNAAYRQLTPAPVLAESSAKQRELAAQLGSGERGRTFAEWLASRPDEGGATGEPGSDARLESLMAEVEALDDAEAVRPFAQRIAAVAKETVASRRTLLTDSIILDVAAHCRARRVREVMVLRLREVRCSLLALGTPSARSVDARISLALQGSDLSEAEKLVAEARRVLETEMSTLAATARRRAVLHGLAHLGYEVRETMAAAWTKDGRIVVHKPGITDYGIELGAPADAARMQVRVVGSDRPSTPRDAGRDRDMETTWCADFQRLRQLLVESGTDVAVERALEPGAQAVKSVSLAVIAVDERNVVKAPGLRTIR